MAWAGARTGNCKSASGRATLARGDSARRVTRRLLRRIRRVVSISMAPIQGVLRRFPR